MPGELRWPASRRAVARVAPTAMAMALVASFGAIGCGTRARARTGDAPDAATLAALAFANWPMPNPPSVGLPNPQSYDTRAADVVLDGVTGLMWQRALDSDGWLWPDAIARCADLSLAGFDDWRLPSLVELASIVDFTQLAPSIDGTAFPNTVGGTFWSSIPVVGAPGEAWYVAFSTGFTYQGHEDFLPIRVRCVRALGRSAGAQGERYLFPTADTVLDTRTHLTWQRGAEATTHSWDDAGRYCQSLALAQASWRLPSMKELQTLVDTSREMPAIDPVAFPDAPMEQHWTSSPLAGSSTDAWYVSFRIGATNTIARDTPGLARCVH